MKKELETQLEVITVTFEELQDQCTEILNSYKTAIAPDVDKIAQVYHENVKKLYRISKVKHHLEKAIKHLNLLN